MFYFLSLMWLMADGCVGWRQATMHGHFALKGGEGEGKTGETLRLSQVTRYLP